MSINDLAALMQQGFAEIRGEIQTIDKKVDSVKVVLEARMDRQFEELKERTFDPEEKECILAVVEAYNQQLEDAALGTKDIMLTRPEYDATAVVADFPNRFTAPAEAFAD